MFKNLVIKCVYGVARLCFIALSKHASSLLIKLIFNIMKNPEFYNFQVVFKVNDDERIIFAGKTALNVEDLMKTLELRVTDELNILPIESFIYQPFKIQQDETKKNS